MAVGPGPEAADRLGFECTTLGFMDDGPKKRKIPGEQQSCREGPE